MEGLLNFFKSPVQVQPVQIVKVEDGGKTVFMTNEPSTEPPQLMLKTILDANFDPNIPIFVIAMVGECRQGKSLLLNLLLLYYRCRKDGKNWREYRGQISGKQLEENNIYKLIPT